MGSNGLRPVAYCVRSVWAMKTSPSRRSPSHQWNEITPCNLSLERLATSAKEGVHAAGGYPLEFGTIRLRRHSMGMSMRFSLVSREIIADSVEAVVEAERLDGMVTFAGCDKSLPGMLMASARLDVSSVFVYAGSILPGHVKRATAGEGRHHHRRIRSRGCVRARLDVSRRRRSNRASHLSW